MNSILAQKRRYKWLIMHKQTTLNSCNLTTVVHCKKGAYDIYIGRPSKWGNPFKIGSDGTREEVIEKYKKWFMQQPELVNSVSELKGKTLGCWCKPHSCHGDFLAELANNHNE
jgi:hypothetical protein